MASNFAESENGMKILSGHSGVVSAIARAAQPLSLTDPVCEYAGLLDAIGNAQFVLIGEASHGTHGFYRERIEITKLLIEHRGFSAVAVEADWLEAFRVNRFVRERGGDANAEQALSGFLRFPAWMWRNMDVLAFVAWLRKRNGRSRTKVGFYGLDLYSLYTSADEVLRYLEKTDPDAAVRARQRYSCFEQFGESSEAYGYPAGLGLTQSCEDAAVRQLAEMHTTAREAALADGELAEMFSSEENAHIAADAERYYRTMFGGRINSWNLRGQHMADTLERLVRHLGSGAKIVVWAHNSHVGDARATEMGRQSELNLGQLVRQKYAEKCFNIGFTTYAGEVTAASDWDRPAERKIVRPALTGSYEKLFHETGLGDFALLLRSDEMREALAGALLERAIGVVYRPETERASHYFMAKITEQFDAVIHLDRTRALIPLEKSSRWEHGEVPEAYPFAV